MKISKICMTFIAILLLQISNLNIKALEYSDIDDNFAKSAIEYWSDRQVLKGSDGKFRPNDAITRGELAVIINRLFKFDKPKLKMSEFKDLDDNFYTDAMLALYENKIILGHEQKLRPKDFITRQEAAVVLLRAFQLPVSNFELSFKDREDVKEWAKGAVAYMAENSFINGYNNMLRPQDELTRAQLVTILDNMISVYIDSDGNYKKLERSKNPRGIVLINAQDVSLEGIKFLNHVIVSGNNRKLRLNNVGISAKLVLVGTAARVLSLQNSEISNISADTLNLEIELDSKSVIPTDILNRAKIKKMQDGADNKVRNSGYSSGAWYSDEYSPIVPDTPIPAPDNNPNTKKPLATELLVHIEGLESDGKVHISVTDSSLATFRLPQSAILINKNNGENTGKLIDLNWEGSDVTGIQKAVVGEYKFKATSVTNFVINSVEYEMPSIELVIMIE